MSFRSGDNPSTIPGLGGTPRPGARLISVGKAHPGRVFTIGSRGTLIGRGGEADIVVNGNDVSRRHARIAADGDTWTIEDLGSHNGTLVNGESVHKKPLAFGDRIQLGDSALFIFTRYDAVEDKLLELQKMEVVGQLAGGVAHDFNNLFAAIKNNLEFIELQLGSPRPDQAEIRACVEESQTALERATEMTRRLLDISRKVDHTEAVVDISELTLEVAQICRRTFGRTIVVEEEIAPDLAILGDRPQLHQVLMNLCFNARDAMSSGGTLKIALWRERMSEELPSSPLVLAPGNQIVVLAVADDGEGIDEQVLARIFEPFFSTKRDRGGTGLGLATVYNVVKRHGGEVEVTSERGRGTTFRVLLPWADTSRSGAQTLHRSHARHTEETGSFPLLSEDKQHVLLVDDEEDVIISTGKLLRAWGYHVLSARSGAEAIKLFERNRAQIGCVLLDLVMPTLSGQETLRILRTIDPEVPVVLTTGHTNREEIAELLPAVDGVVAKPHEPETLQLLLKQILS